MRWLLWRQHRFQLAATSIILALFATAVAVTGVHMADVYANAVHDCANGGCFVEHLFNGYGAIIDIVHLTVVLPVLLGAFIAAPLLAREAEHGTNALVWTQTVTRRRWVLSKVGTVVGATVVLSAVVAALVTWWSGTTNTLDGNRFGGVQFDTQNVLPVAFTLFAVGLGLALGAAWRRVLPAVATTVGVYLAVRLAVAVYLRPHYMTAVRIVTPASTDSSTPSGAWNISSSFVGPDGHTLSGRVQVPAACGTNPSRTGLPRCLDRLGYHNVSFIQPASRYWTFQLIESAIFVALAVALVVFAITRTLRRDA
jgi:ABC-type transport system involved in multi-copper enzyme maturation permease subunit